MKKINLALISIFLIPLYSSADITAAPETAPSTLVLSDDEIKELQLDDDAPGSEAPISAPQVSETAPEPEPVAEETEIKEEETAAVAPIYEPVAIETTPSQSIKEFKDPRIPGYQLVKPSWGMSTGFSLKGVGNTGDFSAKMLGLSFQLDYQPKFFQKLGILGLGPSLNIYRPKYKKDNVTRTFFGFIGVGAQVRYQARFFREQVFVPYAGFKMEYYKYTLSNGKSGGLIEKGPFIGGMVLLNWFEPSAAAEAYVNYGISRTYAFAEYRNTSGSDATVKVSGSTTYFGFRFEF